MDDDQTPQVPPPPPRPDAPAGSTPGADGPFVVAPGGSGPTDAPSSAPGEDPSARAAADASTPDTPPKKKKKGLSVPFVAIAIVVVLAVAAGAIVLTKLSGTGDVLVGQVPANSVVYATAYLDPAAHQKMNLESLLNKFPALKTEGAVSGFTKTMDTALSSYGLRYESDIQPWLGSQIGFEMQSLQSQSAPVILISSKDDNAAAVALKKLRSSSNYSNLSWTDQQYKGSTISIGNGTVAPATTTPGGTTALSYQAQAFGAPTFVYTIVDGTVVLTDNVDAAKAVIDTSSGDAANLGDSADYQATMNTLPNENLAMAYVNLKPLIQRMQQFSDGLPGAAAAPPNQFGLLNAIKGIGETVSADPDGIAVDISMPIDSSKLSASQKAALDVPAHQNSVLAFTPSNAAAVFAGTGFDKQLKAILDQLQSSQMLAGMDQALGLDTVIGTLTGDVGVEVQPGPTTTPTGALLIGTSDTAATEAFLDRLAGLAQSGLAAQSAPGGGSNSPALAPPAVPWTTENYNGVTIKELQLPPTAAASGFAPAYAVTDGMAIVGATPDAVKSVIDAHANNQTITSSADFKAAMSHGSSTNNQLFYANVQSIASEIRGAMSSDEQQTYDSTVAPNVAHIKSVSVTSSSTTSGTRARLFVLIS